METIYFIEIKLLDIFKEQNFNFEIKTGQTDTYIYRGIIFGWNAYLVNGIQKNSDRFHPEVERIYKNGCRLISFIDYYINNRYRRLHYNDLPKDDVYIIKGTKTILERIEEFDVIKNNRLDLISLDNLLDFYEVRYLDKLLDKSLENRVFPDTIK